MDAGKTNSELEVPRRVMSQCPERRTMDAGYLTAERIANAIQKSQCPERRAMDAGLSAIRM